MTDPQDDITAAGDGSTGDQQSLLKDLSAQVQKLTDIAARAQADLQNAKTRMQKDGEDLRRFATESVVRSLLPVLDHFRRASSHLPKDLEGNEWVKGVVAIEQELSRVLADLGLKRMEVMSQQVDTARHEVLMIGPGAEGEIVEIFEDGYELSGKVLRPAKVKVGDGTNIANS